jgi:hypothetical protein
MWQWIKKLFGKLSGVTQAPASPNLPSGATTSFTVEPPKTSYDERKVFTPNKGNKVIIPEAVVLHHSDGSYREAASGSPARHLRCPTTSSSPAMAAAPCSAKTPNAPGTPARATGSAGQDLNSWSLGLAWEGNTYDYPLGDDAMASAIEWLAPRMRKWGIPMSMVVTHQQVAPTRKTDISPGDADRFRTKLKAALN